VSVRLQITIWNVVFLACLLLGMGIALRWTLQASLMSAVDKQMMSMARADQEMASMPASLAPPPLPPVLAAMRTDKDSPVSRFSIQAWDVRGRATRPPNATPPYVASLYRRAMLGQESVATIQLDGARTRLVYVPLRRGGNLIGVSQISASLAEMDREVQGLSSVLLLLIGPGLVIAGVGGALLTRRALIPVRQITEAAERIEAEDLSSRLPVRGHDELSELALTFNGMLSRLEDAFKRQQDVNELQRRFTTDASHELKTPLTVIQGTVSLALSSPRTPQQYEEALRTVSESSTTMNKIVHDLLILARSDAGLLNIDPRPVSLWEIVNAARESLAVAGPCANVNVTIDRDITIDGDPDHLTRLFLNLIDNALRHTPAHGDVTVSAQPDDDGLIVTVADTGVGIPYEHLSHVFDRFYRVDTARSKESGGTGIGLAICKSIVEAHGGAISVFSEPGRGSQFSVFFPQSAKKGVVKSVVS